MINDGLYYMQAKIMSITDSITNSITELILDFCVEINEERELWYANLNSIHPLILETWPYVGMNLIHLKWPQVS